MLYRVVSGVALSAFLAGCGQESSEPNVSYEGSYSVNLLVSNPVPADLDQAAVFVSLPATAFEQHSIKVESQGELFLQQDQTRETQGRINLKPMLRGEKRLLQYSVQFDRDYYESFSYESWLNEPLEPFYPNASFQAEEVSEINLLTLEDKLPSDNDLVSSLQEHLDDLPEFELDSFKSNAGLVRLSALHDQLSLLGRKSVLVSGIACSSENICEANRLSYVLVLENDEFYPTIDGYFLPFNWIKDTSELVRSGQTPQLTGMGVEVVHQP
ncbi:MAG: hypothetical protein ACR2PX_04460 [Endozoicomonas sp.]|uniref:hypothetical protein n=1 Tax=Endozoicomonas sp. TaxID=1892382 RepID=UPI003D9BEEAA